ncbi:MAG: lamin tail domain-containing protein [Calditrichaceae bacterium]
MLSGWRNAISGIIVTGMMLLLIPLTVTPVFAQSDMIITGVVDGPLTGGLPKAVEFYTVNNIADLSIYGFGSANNGGGTDGEEFTFPAVSVTSGTFLYVATESAEFSNFFGFSPDYTSGSAPSINGDDAIELFKNGSVVDVFGDINVDGTGQPWDYLDGWAYRVDGTGPDGTAFVLANWTFSGINALDNETTNASAATPFPIGTFVPGAVGDAAPAVASTNPVNMEINIPVGSNIEINFSEDVLLTGSWFDITGAISGSHTATVSGGPINFILDPDMDFEAGETVTVTVFAAQVTDADSDDPPDNMTADFVFSFTSAGAPSVWVINEIHADPAGDITGDANGDGVRDSGQDEFVEIINNSGADVDISGWTLADAFSIRHTFPSGTVIPDQCPVVIFGGGTPTGAFGRAIVQTASSGLLGLNNSGDTVTLNDGVSDISVYTYGSEGGDNQSITRDPDITGPDPLIKHTAAAGSGGSLFSPGTKVDGSIFDGCVIETREIFEIQGPGLTSPFEGQTVLTVGNIVTTIAPNGFFIQTPPERADGDNVTSDGIFVFTGSAPSVTVGDNVDVTAKIQEFFNFTELGAVENITINSTGNALPPAVQFDSFIPSPNQPQPDTELERFEGMLISIGAGTVTGSNQRFSSDPVAEVYIAAGSDRAFREPGIEYPGLPGLPVWDGNPEVFELDPDKLGSPNQIIPAGSSFSAVGVLGYEFGGYEFWPSSLTVMPKSLPSAVRSRREGEMTVGSLNFFRLFDNVDDPGTEDNGQVVSADEYTRRLNKFSIYIREVLASPDILAVQEVEKLGVLNDLAEKIHADDPSVQYTAYLVEGNDVGGIDVGFLTRNSVRVNTITQLGATEIMTYDGSLLHDRPPLLLEGDFIINGVPEFPISVMAVHNRSLGGIDNPTDGPRVRQKRLEQAQSIAQKVQDLQIQNPDIHLVVTGDFNAYEFTDGYVDAVGQISGDFVSDDNLLSGPDLVNPNLTNQVLSLPAGERYSFIFRGSGQVLDHALTSAGLNIAVTGFEYGRANADAAVDEIYSENTPLRSSDHDGLVMFLDVTPPEIVVNEQPAILWPPNHKYQRFNISDFVNTVSDGVTPDMDLSDVYITSVTSDEPENGRGDGDTYDDIVIVNCKSVDLRSEREGDGNGRVYTIHVAAEDRNGNIGTASFQVQIPKDKKGDPAVDDGPVYEVINECGGPEKAMKPDSDSASGDELSLSLLPTEFSLDQNYPNPFNPETFIRFSLPEAVSATIRIYNILGQEVRVLTDNYYEAGLHSVRWDGKDNSGTMVSSGMYLYELRAGSFVQVKKMFLLR